jgi:uncharacterized membrane-anchored protein
VDKNRRLQAVEAAESQTTERDNGCDQNAALVFVAGLLVLAAAYYFASVSQVFLFWAAFILTRPLGATLGDDLFDKPSDHGGFAFSRTAATAILAAATVAMILVIPQRPGVHPGAPAQATAE